MIYLMGFFDKNKMRVHFVPLKSDRKIIQIAVEKEEKDENYDE